jgi:hypothetical protein
LTKRTRAISKNLTKNRGEGVWQFEAGNALKGLELLGKYSGTFKNEDKGITNNININLESLLAKVSGENEY